MMPNEHEQRVQVQVAVLHAGQAAGGAPAERGEAVQRAVEELLVAELQEDAIRNPVQRPPDQPVVGLVDEVLAGEHAVQRREAAAQPLGALGVAAEQIRGGGESGEGERDRDDDERRLEVLELGHDVRQRQQRLEKMRHRQKAADRRQDGQHDQHAGHRRRRLVHVVLDFRRHPRAAEEREPQQPEHVERRQQRGRRGHREEQRRAAAAAGEREPEDLVLGEESGERRDAGDGGGRNGEGREGHGNPAREPAHLADVLLAAERVDHAARAEEQARLEERVRVEMEDRHAVRADAQRHEHEAELRDRRVREHLLDVGLHDGDRRREESGERADRGDHRARLRRVQIDAGHARDQIHAGGHHRRRVDQRRHRCRAGHRVRQPDVQRDLRRLARRADEQQDADEARRHRGWRRPP